ncbi:hypothetical protein [Leifsonia sp. NCR5]|uniref:hypothetical protein n=1 Tax=Leifsonia sp. NCR5 TaxID=1978342 RepID=UPI000A1991CA|nr:hypothetical protein [Leifsonia sp. NCR5]
MRQSDVNHIREVVARVSGGDDTLTRSDYVALLILVREIAPNESMLKDLSHSIAHDSRDRGYAFEYLTGLIKQIRMAISFNKPFEVKVLFPIDDLANEINGVLHQLGIVESLDMEDAAVRARLAAGIASAVAATTFRIKHASGLLGITPDGEYLVILNIEGLPTDVSNLEGIAVPWLISRNEK